MKSRPANRATARSNVPAARSRAKALETFRRLTLAHPTAHCELDHRDPFQLLVATVLSAQSTDVAVNRVTPVLFASHPTPEALASAKTEDIEKILARLGMFRQKSKNIIGLARKLLENHRGMVPKSLSSLIELPGVGRKTANVVLGVAFGTPEGIVVDTHVQRVCQRLGFTEETEPVPIERDLMALFPKELWDTLSHTIIFHGRRICTARNPACAACSVNDACSSAFRAELVGRKPVRTRRSSSPAGRMRLSTKTGNVLPHSGNTDRRRARTTKSKVSRP